MLFVYVQMQFVCRPSVVRTWPRALKTVKRTVAFENSLLFEASLLELSIDVAGEHERTVFLLGSPSAQNVEPFVRYGTSTEIEPMAVEAPRTDRMAVECFAVGDVLKADSVSLQRRICTPKTICVAKVG